jgi:hypothetical protein
MVTLAVPGPVLDAVLKRRLHLGLAQDLGAESHPVDNDDCGRHEVAAIHGEQELLLHLRLRHLPTCARSDAPSAP